MEKIRYNPTRMLKKSLNYIGQLRLYSLIDLIVFLTVLTRDPKEIAGASLLWIAFLSYLESKHKDPLRLPIPSFLWILFALPAFFIFPFYVPILFGIFSYCYTQKKTNRFFGATSPFWRGLQNSFLAFLYNPTIGIIAFFLVSIRNLVGDFRDIEQDKETTTTLPILLGFNKNQKWAYSGHLLMVILTTLFWATKSQFSLSIPLIAALGVIQALSYPLTPRLTNPPFFQNLRKSVEKKMTAHV